MAITDADRKLAEFIYGYEGKHCRHVNVGTCSECGIEAIASARESIERETLERAAERLHDKAAELYAQTKTAQGDEWDEAGNLIDALGASDAQREGAGE